MLRLSPRDAARGGEGVRVVVEHGLRSIHQLLAVLDVAGVTRKRVHHPELREREPKLLILPAHRHSIEIQLKVAATEQRLPRVRSLHRIETAKQCGDPRHEVGQADVLGEVVIRAEPQAGYGIELAVACGQENDRQIVRHISQAAA